MKLKYLSKKILKCSNNLATLVANPKQKKQLYYFSPDMIINNSKDRTSLYIFINGYALHYQYINNIPTYPPVLWQPGFIFPFNNIIEQNFKKEQLKMLTFGSAYKINLKQLNTINNINIQNLIFEYYVLAKTIYANFVKLNYYNAKTQIFLILYQYSIGISPSKHRDSYIPLPNFITKQVLSEIVQVSLRYVNFVLKELVKNRIIINDHHLLKLNTEKSKQLYTKIIQTEEW